MGTTSMPANIIKGPVHQHLDAQLNHRDTQGAFDRRPAILAALHDPAQDYIRVLKDLCQVPEPEADYVASRWYDPNWAAPESPCWWKADQPLEPIVRQSLLHAIEVANEACLPIASYWMPVSEQCEVLVTRSAAQVTRLLLTPLSPLQQTRRPQRLQRPSVAGPLVPIVKGPGATHLDAQLNHRDVQGRFDRRPAILAALQDATQDYRRILADLGQVPEPVIDHIGTYWYDANWAAPESPCWWKDEQPLEPTIRQSLISAITIANQADLPIDSYWLPIFDRCRVPITHTEAQVTRLILTPPPPLPPPIWRQPVPAGTDIWVIKRGVVEAWEEVVSAREGSPPSRITRLKTAP